MNPFNIQNLLRDNIKQLVPYSSARDEFQGQASVFLDANENPYGSPLDTDFNRYPDPLQIPLTEATSKIKRVPLPTTPLGNRSDAAHAPPPRAFRRPPAPHPPLPPPTHGQSRVP